MADTDKQGVLEQHRDRLDNDPDYRDAALTPPSPTDKVGISAKWLEGTAPTTPAAADLDAPAAMVVNDPHPELSDPGQPGNPGTTAEPSDQDSNDEYDQLKGEDLDKAAADAEIEGRSTMTADQKRAALRNQPA